MQTSLDGISIITLLAIQIYLVRKAILFDLPIIKKRLDNWSRVRERREKRIIERI